MKAWTSAAAPPQWLEYDLGKARRGKIVLVPRLGIGQTSKLSARTARTTPPPKKLKDVFIDTCKLCIYICIEMYIHT